MTREDNKTLLGALNERDAAAGMTQVEKQRRARRIAVTVLGTAAAITVMVAGAENSDQPGVPTHQPTVPAVSVEHNLNQTELLEQQEAAIDAHANQP